MILKKLEINGFKSFADRIDLSFGRGITGIVGPNGSGKSNVADAVRWVLGEQSAKQLRGATMSDIIFNGTEKRKQQQYCEVSLTFDNSDKSLASDYDEIMVTRRVYRNGDGEYFLNRAPCRLKDVVDLFRDTGIGRDGYSLIGQGRIDEILSLRSEDRRAIFEEAAGIVKYKARKTEAERRLEHAGQNLTRIEDIMSELEKSLEPLKKQAETARCYLQLSERLRSLELAYFAYQHQTFSEKAEALTAQIRQCEKESVQNKRIEEEYENSLHALEQGIEVLEGSLAVCRDDVVSMTRESEAASGEVQLLEQKASTLQSEKKRLSSQIQEARNQLALLEETDGQNPTSRKEKELAALQAELTELESHIDRAQSGLNLHETQLEERKQVVIYSLNRLSDVKAAQSRMSAMKEGIQNRLDAIARQEAEFTPKGELLSSASQAAALAEREARQEHLQLKAMLDRTAQKQQALRESLTNAFAQQERITGASRELASRLKLLEQMQRDYEGYNQSVKEVLRFAGARNDRTIHGIVANILTVPGEIEKAVEMALGAQSQHIVCETEQDAKRMIEYLRKNRYGRATFLPISSVTGRTLNQQERVFLNMPGCIGVASEMISFNSRYQSIVENLLGRTVIARDLDRGIEIMRGARHSFRLVTLEGDIINPGGSMTGGSTHTRMTSILSREREITEHRASLAKVQEKVDAAANAIEQIQAQREKLRVEIAELSERVRQQEIACARDAERLLHAKEQQNQHADSIKRLMLEKDQLEESLADVESSLGRIQNDAQGGNLDSDEAQNSVLALSQTVNEERSSIEALREKHAQLRVALSATDNEIRLIRRDQQHAAKERDRLSEALVTLGGQLSMVESGIPSNSLVLAASKEKNANAKTALDEKAGQLALLEHKRIKKQQEQRAINESLLRLRVEARETVEKQHKAELQLSRMQSDLQARTERIWEDYSITFAGALPFLTEDFAPAKAQGEIDSIRREIRAMGSVNVAAIDEYRQSSQRYEQLSSQKADILRAIEDLRGIIKELESKMRKQFVEQFDLMNQNFADTFARLFGGGHAELKLSNNSEPLTCGIEIVAQPPGKKLQLLSLLSGGERALTAIAILFAILLLKPTPFCILDEIDAALDEANVANFARFLSDFSSKTQFIVVTHRKGTMESCNGLYGISMEEKGISKIVSVSLSE